MATGPIHTRPGALTRGDLEALYARLEKPMYNVVYRWLWDTEEARDVVQETFCRLWRARDRVNMATIEPFVYKIALNLASNRRRTRSLWRLVSWDRAPSTASDRIAADDSLELSERRAAVRRALDKLPGRQKRVIVLCELSGMTYDQVAATLGIPPGTVASRRHAALKKLRRSLASLALENSRHDDRGLESTSL